MQSRGYLDCCKRFTCGLMIFCSITCVTDFCDSVSSLCTHNSAKKNLNAIFVNGLIKAYCTRFKCLCFSLALKPFENPILHTVAIAVCP